MIINTEKIEQAIFKLCTIANEVYPQELYDIVYEKYINERDFQKKTTLKNILLNANLSYKTRRPLCQDTGQVIVFAQIGQSVQLVGKNIEDSINDAVKRAYTDNVYRKSTVKNAIFDRENSNNNTPAIIYTKIVGGNEITLQVLIKGAGSENCSITKMFLPSSKQEDIFKFIKDNIISSGEKSCPPLILGVGIGATMDKAAVLSKEAFFNRDTTNHEKAFISDLKKYLGEITNDILHIHIKTCATHIACLPVALTMNCHSSRHAECKITSENIKYKNSVLNTKDLPNETDKIKEVYTDDIDSLTKLQKGEKILLTGNIYTARDAAHKRLYEDFKATGEVPFVLKDKIIFYAGPCPAKSEEVIGPIGPTTSYRMDKYTDFIYSNGVIATVGKGERSEEALDIIKKHNGKYFVAQGGIACLLANCVKSSEIIAFEDLGTEAIRKLYVEKLPLTVVI